MKDKPETLIQPTMGIKWSSGNLLDMVAHMPSTTQNNPKRTKRNNQERRNIHNHNGTKANLQLIHKPHRFPNEMLGLNQDDHPYRMCNETQIPGIPMVVMVTSRACSLRNPTQQDFINARTLPIYKCHTCFKFSRTLQSTLCNIVYNQEGTPKMMCMLISWEMRESSMSFAPILPKPSQHTMHKVLD